MENYEHKYNKLVNAIKVLQETNPSDEGIQNWVKDNVPELAESRDEKVRKWIYNYFRSCFPTWIHPDITCGEILDWLEKQGEQKETLCDKCRKEQPSHSCQDITELGRCALEKQGEQILANSAKNSKDGLKPAWSEEDEKAINDIMWIIEAYRENGFNETHKQMANNAEKWLKSLKQRKGWKPSDKQMKALDSAIDEFDGYQEFDSLISLKEDLEKLKGE